MSAVAELIAMLEATDREQGSTIFNHTPEEIGLHVMENHEAILAALRTWSDPVRHFPVAWGQSDGSGAVECGCGTWFHGANPKEARSKWSAHVSSFSLAPQQSDADALRALRLHVEYEATPSDRGGKSGRKGRAWAAFVEARDAALSANAGEA